MIFYLVMSLLIYGVLAFLDYDDGLFNFMSEFDHMKRVGLSFIWPITLLILILRAINK